jgi:hypothetical protein
MVNGIGRAERKARKAAGFALKVNAVEAKMREEGWTPIKLPGHSKRYRVNIPGVGPATVALKVMGPSYRGAIGFAQKTDGEWHTPLTDSDYLLYATPFEDGTGVWFFPMERVIERAELVQARATAHGWAPEAPLYFNIFPEAPYHKSADPCQLNFAEGEQPFWLLPNTQPGQQPRPEPQTEVTASPLTGFTIGQLLDELQRRGLKSFSFGE